MKSSKTVAHEFLRLARERSGSVKPLQLMKLVYIAHGWILALYHRALVGDKIEAWTYGPVIPILYEEVRRCRGRPVSRVEPAPGEALDELEADLVR